MAGQKLSPRDSTLLYSSDNDKFTIQLGAIEDTSGVTFNSSLEEIPEMQGSGTPSRKSFLRFVA